MRVSSHWFLVLVALLWSTSTCTPERNFANHDDDGSGQGGESSVGGETGTPNKDSGGTSGSTGGSGDSGGKSGDGTGGDLGNPSGGAATGGSDSGGSDSGGSDSGGSDSGGSDSGGSDSGGSDSGGSGSGGSGSGGGGTPPVNLSAELVLHLKMDEAVDAMVATDSSGAGNDANVEDSNVSFVEGRFGNAAEFNGFGWLTVPDDPSLDDTAMLTMSAWVNFSNVSSGYSHGIFAKRRAFADQTAYALFLWNSTASDDSGNRMYVDIDEEDDANRLVSQTEFEVENWYHVVAVFDGSLAEEMRVRIYIDGELDREGYEASSQVGRHSGADLLIGNLPGGGNVMRGMIDELALWRRALSAEEIAWLAQNEF